MIKLGPLDYLYMKSKTIDDFNFDMLTAPPLYSLLTPMDIAELNRIARSVKLSGKIEEKYRLIDNIMTNRGFVKLHAGTNRVVYRFIEDQRFVVKVAVDKVGLGDNPAEFRNQFLLKPFVTKVFEVSPCGTCGIFERVDAIMSREEYMSVADCVYDLLTKFVIGKYVLEDIGTHYFMNVGIRSSFGPVLLDFPYVFELDGKKLYCNAPVDPFNKTIRCGGEIDYDDGFNNLVCTRCGKKYQVRELAKSDKERMIMVGGKKTMKVKVKVGKDVILDTSKKQVSKVIEPPAPKKEPTMKVQLSSTYGTMGREKPKDSIFNKIEEEPVIKEVLDEMKEEIEHEGWNYVEPEEVEEDKITTAINKVNGLRVIRELDELPTDVSDFKIGDVVLINKYKEDEETGEKVLKHIGYVFEGDKFISLDPDFDGDTFTVTEINDTEEPIENEEENMHEETPIIDSMMEELDEAIEDGYDDEDEDDFDQYDDYLSNRERQSIRKERKQNRANSNFSEF